MFSMCKNPSSSSSSSYDWSPCQGCYLEKVTVYNSETGASFKPVCKSYRCKKHGWMHKRKLEEAVEKYLRTFEYVRMWTFTLSPRACPNRSEHAKLLSKVWRYFITEVRRNKLLLDTEKSIQYIRFSEPHKSGYFHFHILVDRYIQWYKFQALWLRAIESVTGKPEKLGHVNVKGSKTPKQGAYYVAKYVSKSAELAERNMKLWTKSSRVSIFPKKIPNKVYVVHNQHTNVWFGCFDSITLTCLKKQHLHKTKPKIPSLELFSYLLPDKIPKNPFVL